MMYTHAHRSQYLILGTAILFALGFIMLPNGAQAAVSATWSGGLTGILNDPNSTLYTGWEFFRKLVNYAIVGGLMIVAFSNTLRISIDTYAVKKVLPTLFIAFVLSNFSLLIAHILNDVASSLSLTANDLAGGLGSGGGVLGTTGNAVGMVTALGDSFLKSWSFSTLVSGAVASGVVGAGALASLGFSFTALPFGLPVIIAAALILLGIVVIPMLGLWLLFALRYYVLQLAIMLAPVFVMGMAFPFTRSYFQKWMNVFVVWMFMRPISSFILAGGALALRFGSLDGLLGGLVTFAIVVGAFIGALVVPFQLGTAAAGLVKMLSNFALGSGRMALAGGLGAAADKYGSKNVGLGKYKANVGDMLRGAQGLTRLPETFASIRARKEAQVKAETDMQAGKLLRQHDVVDHAARGLIADKAKETALKAAQEKFKHQRDALKRGDYFDSTGVIDNYQKEGDSANYYLAVDEWLKTLSSGEAEKEAKFLLGKNKGNTELFNAIFRKTSDGKVQLRDSAAAKELLTHATAGAMLDNKEITDKNGKKQKRWVHGHDEHSELVAAKGREWNMINKSKQFWERSATIDTDIHGHTYIRSEAEMHEGAAHNIGDADPQAVTKGQNASSLRRWDYESNDAGSRAGQRMAVLDGSMIDAIAIGKYGAGAIGEIARMSQEGNTALAEILDTETGEGIGKIEEKVKQRIKEIIAERGYSENGTAAKKLRRSAYATLAALQQHYVSGENKGAAGKAIAVLEDYDGDVGKVADITSRIGNPKVAGREGGGKKRWSKPTKQRRTA